MVLGVPLVLLRPIKVPVALGAESRARQHWRTGTHLQEQDPAVPEPSTQKCRGPCSPSRSWSCSSSLPPPRDRLVSAPVTLCTAVPGELARPPPRHRISSWEAFPVGPVCPSAPTVNLGAEQKDLETPTCCPSAPYCRGVRRVSCVGGGFLGTQGRVGKGHSECLPMSHPVGGPIP